MWNSTIWKLYKLQWKKEGIFWLIKCMGSGTRMVLRIFWRLRLLECNVISKSNLKFLWTFCLGNFRKGRTSLKLNKYTLFCLLIPFSYASLFFFLFIFFYLKFFSFHSFFFFFFFLHNSFFLLIFFISFNSFSLFFFFYIFSFLF